MPVITKVRLQSRWGCLLLMPKKRKLLSLEKHKSSPSHIETLCTSDLVVITADRNATYKFEHSNWSVDVNATATKMQLVMFYVIAIVARPRLSSAYVDTFLQAS